jgi:acyl-CoA reductase-like NAD-dependent aldehyde dehydrogenase
VERIVWGGFAFAGQSCIIDHMPYGGVKSSGFGREGVKYAIEEMAEPRLLVLNLD